MTHIPWWNTGSKATRTLIATWIGSKRYACSPGWWTWAPSAARRELGIGQPAATKQVARMGRNSARACCIGPRMACRPPMSASATTKMQAHRAPRRGSPFRGRADAVAGSRNAAHQHLGRLRPPRAGADGAGLHARPCAADGGPELRRPLRQSGRAGRGRGGAHGPAGRFLAGRDLPGQQPLGRGRVGRPWNGAARPPRWPITRRWSTAPRRATPSGISPAANNLSVLLDAARDGFGIAVLPRYVADETCAEGPSCRCWRTGACPARRSTRCIRRRAWCRPRCGTGRVAEGQVQGRVVARGRARRHEP